MLPQKLGSTNYRKHEIIIFMNMAVLIRVTIGVIKHHDPSNFRRKRFIWLKLPSHCLSLEKFRTVTQVGLEAGGRN